MGRIKIIKKNKEPARTTLLAGIFMTRLCATLQGVTTQAHPGIYFKEIYEHRD